jgi:pimeloyl-ACP methyl ester carboxylesterase
MVRGMRPPSRLLWAAELPRAAFGLASLLGARRLLETAPRGDGRPILLLPGLINSDRSLVVLRRYLRRLGYRAEGWGLGRNFGVRAIGYEGTLLLDRVRALHAETGQRVTLIGVSLGGLMARYAAHRLPDLVAEVITISSPFAGSPRATNVWRTFQVLTGEQIDAPNVLAQRKLVAEPLPVPSTAIWSRSDGFVNGDICHDAHGDTIEVRSSHVLVQVRPEVLLAVARVLGQRKRRPAA